MDTWTTAPQFYLLLVLVLSRLTSATPGQLPSSGSAASSQPMCYYTPEVTDTGPGFNRGSGGGARGCGFEERVDVNARTGGIHFL